MTTLVRNGIVLPMTRGPAVLDPGAVLIDGETILAVGPVDEVDADPRAAGAEVVDATGHAVLPGLHNGHLHSGLLRGTAESLSLWDWLRTYVDPAHRALTPEIARAASLQCYAEGLLAGTTSVMDMWRFMEGSAAVADALGIRATLVPYVADEEGYDYFESIASNRALLEAVGPSASGGRVRAWVGLEHLMYCTPQCFADAMALAEEFDTGLHTHSSESIWEVQESLSRFGRRPIEEFFNRGILSARLPASSDPVTASSPRARAPSMVAMARMSHGSPSVGSSVDTFWRSEANFISSNRSRLLFSFSPSVPRPTATPAARRSRTRAGPDASFMLEHGQCTTDVPVWARRAISRSSSQTQWATTVRADRMPRLKNSSMGRRPKRLRDSCTSQIDSELWVCRPVSYSSARAMAPRKQAAEQ